MPSASTPATSTAAADLFRHAQNQGRHRSGRGNLDRFGTPSSRFGEDNVIRYDDGTPRTKHVITNANIDVDEAAGTGTCRSYYTVFQQLDGFTLQPIIAGRYHDEFERVGGAWRWSFRDYSLVDLIGDLSRHLTMTVEL